MWWSCWIEVGQLLLQTRWCAYKGQLNSLKVFLSSIHQLILREIQWFSLKFFDTDFLKNALTTISRNYRFFHWISPTLDDYWNGSDGIACSVIKIHWLLSIQIYESTKCLRKYNTKEIFHKKRQIFRQWDFRTADRPDSSE